MASRKLQVVIKGDYRTRTACDHWRHGWSYRLHWFTRWGR